MDIVDLFFRFAALGVLLLLCVHFAKERRSGWLGIFGALFTLSIAAYVVCSSPNIRPHLGWLFQPLLFPAIASPLLFYLFARALFDDHARPTLWHGGVLAILEATAYLHIVGVAPMEHPLMLALFAVNRAAALGIAISAVASTLRGRATDLIEGRRQFRVVFVAVVGVYLVLVLSIEALFSEGPAPLWLDLLNAGGILFVSASIALYVLRVRTELLIPPTAQQVTAPVPAEPLSGDVAAAAAPIPTPIDPVDGRIIDALRRAMESDRLYRQEGLAIAALAKQLGTQEHRLRRIINQHLGYRNFAAFLNQYRIAEVCAALADPAKTHLPVLTIAMDAGYRSLGPFNSAFKLATGVTPTEFRRARPPGEQSRS